MKSTSVHVQKRTIYGVKIPPRSMKMVPVKMEMGPDQQQRFLENGWKTVEPSQALLSTPLRLPNLSNNLQNTEIQQLPIFNTSERKITIKPSGLVVYAVNVEEEDFIEE